MSERMDDATREQTFSSTHHTFIVGPWNRQGDEVGGVAVRQLDDPDSVVLLLRTKDEVDAFCLALLAASEQEADS